ncbi:MAG TPA: OadG family protein [bacterium]|nr:OadG family protein [bacterium]
MLIDGLRVMVIGMSVVFFLLTFIVVSVAVSSRAIRFFGLDRALATQGDSSAAAGDTRGHLAAVIAAAVARFRSERK